MKTLFYRFIKIFLAVIILSFSLTFLSSCSDYTYEPQLITEESKQGARFKHFYTMKILYDAAGKGEEEFNRVYEEITQQYHSSKSGLIYDEYYFSSEKHRDEFLTEYNDFKDVQILGTKDDFFIDSYWIGLIPRPALSQKDINYCYQSIEGNVKFSIFMTARQGPYFASDDDYLFQYTGETFTARVCLENTSSLYTEDGSDTQVNCYSYDIYIYDLNGNLSGNIDYSYYRGGSADPLLEERITRWLNHLYLAPFHEVVQNAKAP